MAFMSLSRWVASGVVLLLGATACAAVVLPLNNDFEASDGYDLGPAAPGNGWAFSASLSAMVVDHAFSGDQALSLTGSGWLTFTAEGWAPGFGSSVTWIDFYLKPVFADSTALPSEVNSALAAVTGFVKKTGSIGEVYAVDGDGVGGGDWTASGYTISLLDERAAGWLRISYRIDYGNKRWDLFVDGNLILADLGFADNEASPFAQFRLRGDAEKATFLDYFYAGAENPLYADTSGTGLPDSWLLAHGLNPSTAQRHGDPDHDGVDNLTEFMLGLSPNSPDSDNDGVFDRRELLWGTNPKVANPYILGGVPFFDSFEDDAVGLFENGARLWQVQKNLADTVTVSSSGAPAGSHALILSGTGTAVQRNFVDASHSAEIWLDFYVKTAPSSNPPQAIPQDVAAVFYTTANGKIVVLDGVGNGGGEWRQLGAVLPTWNRLVLRMNYSSQRWGIWVNGVPYADNLGFAHPVPYFSGFGMQHGTLQSGASANAPVTSGLDALRVQTTSIWDSTILPDSWRLRHFGTLYVDPAGDYDTDGINNLVEYQQGRIPTIVDNPAAAGGVAVWYVDSASGSDAYSGNSFVPNVPVVGDGPKASLGAALLSAGSNARIIISAGAGPYVQNPSDFAGTNVVLRPYGAVHIKIVSP
ncbi:MAG: beta-glucosidase [Rariglobus sp.]|jgi:hypothetical protein|nr:beta-glucosidase [Rariglobus sp.]